MHVHMHRALVKAGSLARCPGCNATITSPHSTNSEGFVRYQDFQPPLDLGLFPEQETCIMRA